MYYTSELKVGIETEIPPSIATGKGTALYIAGWCSHASLKVLRLEVTIANNKQQALLFHSIQPGTASSPHVNHNIEKDNSYTTFWAIVPIIRCDREQLAEVILNVILDDNVKARKKLGEVKLSPRLPENMYTPEIENPSPIKNPLIAIAMATYNPPINLFRKQIQSIIAQSYTNWICLISDDNSDEDSVSSMMSVINADKRFIFSSSNQRLGFYSNFERCLTMVPQSVEYVALSDQDDYWYADKLQTMLDHFDANISLVYSDMRVISESGEVISDTFWSVRKNNTSDLGVQMLINSVTGAASMFAGRLLKYVLPLPPGIGGLHHDHWIGSVAMAVGNLRWIDRPLHDYVQHGKNVTGFGETSRPSVFRMLSDSLRALTTQEGRFLAKQIYFDHVPKIVLLSQVISIRCGSIMSKHNLKPLYRLTHISSSLKSVFWFCFRNLLSKRAADRLNGAEYHIFMGIAWSFIFGSNNFFNNLTHLSISNSPGSNRRSD